MRYSDLTGKKVLFIAPVFYDYHTLIKSKIESLGASVYFFSEKKDGLLFGVLNNLNPYFILLYQRYYYYFLLRKIRKQKFTHFFLIRGYKIPVSFLKELKKINPDIKMIMYQWDSNKNNPYFSKLKYFNKSYTFDYDDHIDNPEIGFLQLFYTDDVRSVAIKNTDIKYDFFCFSSFTFSRYEAMLTFISYCKAGDFRIKTFCYIPFTTYFRMKYFNRVALDINLLSFKAMPRPQYINYLDASDIVVDLNHSTQSGLSMRIIETYGAGKKIFTTNKSILKNPIYSSEWVQLLDIDNIKTPIYSLKKDSNLKQDLYIDNWINILFS